MQRKMVRVTVTENTKDSDICHMQAQALRPPDNQAVDRSGSPPLLSLLWALYVTEIALWFLFTTLIDLGITLF